MYSKTLLVIIFLSTSFSAFANEKCKDSEDGNCEIHFSEDQMKNIIMDAYCKSIEKDAFRIMQIRQRGGFYSDAISYARTSKNRKVFEDLHSIDAGPHADKIYTMLIESAFRLPYAEETEVLQDKQSVRFANIMSQNCYENQL
ncbi:hypothetical protein OAD24_14635 [Pseudomonadales bacterium]|nr:hypothetical protein [Pseudomonadales bacterium]